MDRLLEKYPAIIRLMPDEFSTNKFILKLAELNQREYTSALMQYVEGGVPFRTLNAELAIRLYHHPDLIELVGEVESEDIFRNPSRSALWRKIAPGS
jgi:hypothetical protein